ncbi:hypothetical protein CMK11_22495, partial [Candidatus Poribacteria bacterium]|nr:hypothetical protein [Candidatus Poribacteria bacterium]
MDVDSALTPEQRCLRVNETLPADIYTGEQRDAHPDSRVPWRISPEPYWITPEEHAQFEALGHHILAFYEACNLLYSQSRRGVQPEWVAEYLDIGKDDAVRMYGRMNRFKRQLPLVIRPDVIPTDDGLVISELDSVPGGIGFTASLGQRYGKLGYDIVGGADGMVSGFARMIRSVAGASDPVLAVVVSEESAGYRPEMTWLAEALVEAGLDAHVVGPEDVGFSESGLYLEGAETGKKIDCAPCVTEAPPVNISTCGSGISIWSD